MMTGFRKLEILVKIRQRAAENTIFQLLVNSDNKPNVIALPRVSQHRTDHFRADISDDSFSFCT